MAKGQGLVLLCLALAMSMASAFQFRVGGPKGWSVPDSNAMSYNQWAESSRFQIGDSLLFVYPPGQDSVLQVSEDAYKTCNTASYIQKFDDGNTVFVFNQSGPFYFISGIEDNCKKNESLVVVVMADRNQTNVPSSPPNLTASPPSPSEEGTASPPPPTEGETAFSPPPQQPNGASIRVVGFMGSVGAFLGLVFFVF